MYGSGSGQRYVQLRTRRSDTSGRGIPGGMTMQATADVVIKGVVRLASLLGIERFG